MVDVYGFRGKDVRVAFLSPYEFYMYWTAEALLPPCHPQSCRRSVWTPVGKELYDRNKSNAADVKFTPGKDYLVSEEHDEDVIAFPKQPLLEKFRNRWVMVRHQRPVVPIFHRSKLPRPGLAAEETARLCCVYFRPWTLCADHAQVPHVPHILQLAAFPTPELTSVTQAGSATQAAAGLAQDEDTPAQAASQAASAAQVSVQDPSLAVPARRIRGKCPPPPCGRYQQQPTVSVRASEAIDQPWAGGPTQAGAAFARDEVPGSQPTVQASTAGPAPSLAAPGRRTRGRPRKQQPTVSTRTSDAIDKPWAGDPTQADAALARDEVPGSQPTVQASNAAQAATSAPEPPAPARRCRGKRSRPGCGPQQQEQQAAPTWAASWERYIRGHVVSQHAQRLITNFLTATLARTSADDDDQSDEEEGTGQAKDDDHETLRPSLSEVHKLLRTQPRLDSNAGKLSKAELEHGRAIQRGRSMWSSSSQMDSLVDTSGDKPCLCVKELAKAARAAGEEQKATVMPYRGKTSPSATIYERGGSTQDCRHWLDGLTRRDERPNAEQLQILRDVAERVQQEWLEERADLVASTNDDPLFGLVHGLPGIGKSKVIAWIRELFCEVLGWTHGNQFVCLAHLNTMAANIDGETIHSWSGIPFGDQKNKNTSSERDIGTLFIRCQNLRWILIDEISMVAAELFAELERKVSQAARPIGTYKFRADHSPRPFGGFNVLLFGDWWQLRPVRVAALYDQPSKASSGAAYEGLQLIWGRTRNSLQQLWELVRPMRCDDPWYGAPDNALWKLCPVHPSIIKSS